MAKWEQDSAAQIAAALLKVQRATKVLDRAVDDLHHLLRDKAKEHGPALGIDPAPLSAVPKPD